MNVRENYFAALAHKQTEFLPIYEAIHLKQIGFMDPFEKGGPTGGIDGFGVEWVPTDSADGAVVPTHKKIIMEDILDWKEVVHFPDLDAIDWEAKAARDLEGFDRYKEDRVFEYGMGNGHFERLCDLMGIANALCAMIEERIADIHRAVDTYYGKGSYILGNVNILTGDIDKTNQIMDIMLKEADRYGREIGAR